MPPLSRRHPEWDEPADRPRRRVPERSGGSGKLLLVLLLGGGGFLLLVCCGGLVGVGWWAVRPTSFPEPGQDYADARKGFRTTSRPRSCPSSPPQSEAAQG